jgi:transposase
LLRRGERYPGPGGTWTIKHLAWLRALRFDDPCSQATLADYLAAVELLMGRRKSLIGALEQAIPTCSHADTVARLRCFRGIDTLSAAGVSAEVGSFRRFPKPPMLSGFIGIVPSERTSDTKRRQGSITKAGPVHPRRLLVQAAHRYRYAPNIGQTLAVRQEPTPARESASARDQALSDGNDAAGPGASTRTRALTTSAPSGVAMTGLRSSSATAGCAATSAPTRMTSSHTEPRSARGRPR